VDVNSGRAREGGFLEETACQTNAEAADAIARQLRLRDAGGVIVVDFIDMKDEANARALDAAFRSALRSDRARIQIGGLGHFGLFTLTRQRRGPNDVVGAESVRSAARALREVRDRCAGGEQAVLAVRAHPETAALLESMMAGGGEAVVVADPALEPGAWTVVLP